MSARPITLDALMDTLAQASVGHLAARVDIDDAPEEDPFTILGVALNILLSDLEFRNAQRESAMESLRALNAKLETRVRERTAELMRANRDLESFSYTVAHDLRAPLRGIRALSEYTLRDHGGEMPTPAREQVEAIQRSAEHMAELIETLMRFAHAARDPLRRRSDVDLSALALGILRDLARDDPSRRVHTQVQTGLRGDCDERLVSIALQNLLGNAWKYTSRTPDARIEFFADGTEEGPVYRIRDNGAGFDPEKTGLLFRPFQRVHSANDYPGTGVGLATVRRIIEQHGGRVWAEGQVEKGATFSFTLGPTARDPD